jgi:hypothetical protein
MSDVSGGVQKTQLTVSGILNDLNEGLSRPNIQAKYNLSGKDMKDLFAHPKLKGRKTKPAPSFVLTDDTSDLEMVVAVAPEETQEEISEEVNVTEEF